MLVNKFLGLSKGPSAGEGCLGEGAPAPPIEKNCPLFPITNQCFRIPHLPLTVLHPFRKLSGSATVESSRMLSR